MWSKYIFNFLVLLIFSVSSTGVVVYEHYCTKSGETSHFFSEVNDACSIENDSCEQAREATCCSTTETKEGAGLEENCCSTDVSFFQLISDFSYANANKLLKVNSDSDWIFEESTFLVLKDGLERSLRAPPPKKSLSLSRKRALLQVYRI